MLCSFCAGCCSGVWCCCAECCHTLFFPVSLDVSFVSDLQRVTAMHGVKQANRQHLPGLQTFFLHVTWIGTRVWRNTVCGWQLETAIGQVLDIVGETELEKNDYCGHCRPASSIVTRKQS